MFTRFFVTDDETPTLERGSFWSLTSVGNPQVASSAVVNVVVLRSLSASLVHGPTTTACLVVIMPGRSPYLSPTPQRSSLSLPPCAQINAMPTCQLPGLKNCGASEFLLEELKVLCEHSARKIVSVANVAKMLLAAEKYHAETLKASCLSYVQKNMAEVGCVWTVWGAGEGAGWRRSHSTGRRPMIRRSVAAGQRRV